MGEFDDILGDNNEGEFDDILGKDIPEGCHDRHTNRRLIEMYEKIVEKDMKKYRDHWKKRDKKH